MTQDKPLTVTDAAKFLGCGRVYLYKLLKSDDPPPYTLTIHGKRVFDPAQLQAYKDRKTAL